MVLGFCVFHYLLPILPTFFPPPFPPSLPLLMFYFPNSSRDSSLFVRYYQVVVFQLIERSLLLALHRLSACELGFFSWNFILLIRLLVSAIFFTLKQLLVVLVPSLKAREKSHPSFPSYFTQNLRHSNL